MAKRKTKADLIEEIEKLKKRNGELRSELRGVRKRYDTMWKSLEAKLKKAECSKDFEVGKRDQYIASLERRMASLLSEMRMQPPLSSTVGNPSGEPYSITVMSQV